MSTVLGVKSSDLNKMCTILKNLVPSGSVEIPLGISVENGTLKLICTQGVVYVGTCETEFSGNVSTNILYYDITPLLNSTGDVSITFNNNDVTFDGDGFSAKFALSYSVVTEPDIPEIHLHDVDPNQYLTGIKNILGAGFNKLYGMQSPIIFLGNIALQKFPNTWLQTRVSSLDLQAILDFDHVKLLSIFCPTKISLTDEGSLVLVNSKGILMLPYKPVVDASNITMLLKDMKPAAQVNIAHYLDRLKNMSKLNSKANCMISVNAQGLRSAIKNANSTLTAYAGNIGGEILKVFYLPIQLWLCILKGLQSEYIEVLLGGDKVCLRTQSVIIVTHVLH